MPPITFDEPRLLARAATLIENRRPESAALIAELFPRTGRALTVGITGAPGSGKSTLVHQMIRVLREAGQRVGVIAVDPSSAWTGGAILGDRVRMQGWHGDSGVFIRSMATRGHLGGLARTTTEMTLLLDAAGADAIILETVGVGQDEIDVARVAAVTAVVLVPGMGDDVQAIKAGIMEIADVFIINKADHPGAEKLEVEVRAALGLAGGESPPIVRTVATDGTGVEEALRLIRERAMQLASRDRRVESWRIRLADMLRDRVLEQIPREALEREARSVAARERDPFAAVEALLVELRKGE